MGHPAVGTEHLLLGLMHEGEGMAVQLLQISGVNLAQMRTEIEKVWAAKRPGHDSAA
jgi:ATP-dependent Clp protease ATP-binding subunit ClpC